MLNIISNYNVDPKGLIELIDVKYLIYDQSDNHDLSKYYLDSNFLIKTKNSGHNLSHYFK